MAGGKSMEIGKRKKGRNRDIASFGLGGAMASPKFFKKNIIYIYIYMCVCVLILAILLYKITFFSLKQYN